jgi:acyl carrier protein
MENNKEQELAKIRKDLKEMVVRELSLEDIKPVDIKDDEVLFGEGLGLDSLDAVELVVLLQRNFGMEVKTMDQGKEIFHSIDTMANFVYENRKKTS